MLRHPLLDRNTSMTDATPKNVSAANKNHTDNPCVR